MRKEIYKKSLADPQSQRVGKDCDYQERGEPVRKGERAEMNSWKLSRSRDRRKRNIETAVRWEQGRGERPNECQKSYGNLKTVTGAMEKKKYENKEADKSICRPRREPKEGRGP